MDLIIQPTEKILQAFYSEKKLREDTFKSVYDSFYELHEKDLFPPTKSFKAMLENDKTEKKFIKYLNSTVDVKFVTEFDCLKYILKTIPIIESALKLNAALTLSYNDSLIFASMIEKNIE